ncbi:MAG: CBS domain-containing protein [Planctomycetaceae bacterium]|nr:CBS domain-containing protein [Planctomycetaceae bacterium]
MTTCPYCEHENIDGEDECEECRQPLSFLSKPRAATPIEQCIVKDRIGVLFPQPPFTVRSTTPIGEVLQLLVDQRMGCALVVDEGVLQGVFTERDALFKLNVDYADLLAQPVSKFMTPNPEIVRATDTIAIALHKMDLGGYRHLPVLDDGGVAGVISIRDILRYLSDRLLVPSER